MVQRAGREDLSAVAELAALLWPDHTAGELADIFLGIMSGGNAQFFLSCVRGVPIGLAQCQLRRDYVEGTDSSPVGYLEGIFVREEGMRENWSPRARHGRRRTAAGNSPATANGPMTQAGRFICRLGFQKSAASSALQSGCHSMKRVGRNRMTQKICRGTGIPVQRAERKAAEDPRDKTGCRRRSFP